MELAVLTVLLLAVTGGVTAAWVLTAHGPAARVISAARRLPWPEDGWRALSLAGGLAAIATAAVGLGVLVDDVTEGDGVAVVDHPVAAFVTARRVPELTAVMKAASIAGGPVAMALLAIGSGLVVSIAWRSAMPATAAAVAAAGIAVMTLAFKAALGRPRPPAGQAVADADGYGFPSGHAAAAAALCGVIAWLVTARMRSRRGRAAVWATAAMAAVLVGASRVYLGVHWTTDVLGGWVFGGLWTAVVIGVWTVSAGRTGKGD